MVAAAEIRGLLVAGLDIVALLVIMIGGTGLIVIVVELKEPAGVFAATGLLALMFALGKLF